MSEEAAAESDRVAARVEELRSYFDEDFKLRHIITHQTRVCVLWSFILRSIIASIMLMVRRYLFVSYLWNKLANVIHVFILQIGIHFANWPLRFKQLSDTFRIRPIFYRLVCFFHTVDWSWKKTHSTSLIDFQVKYHMCWCIYSQHTWGRDSVTCLAAAAVFVPCWHSQQ